ncbi:MAG: hypothetical protein PVS2B2_17970 [Candidatus Acidiferrum sp.]
MYVVQKAQNVLRSLIQRYGPPSVKRQLWNAEFRSGRWDSLNNSGDERAHLQIEKYANNGSILDLGCGPGTTGIELNLVAYQLYTGVDISDVAIVKARKRAEETRRADRNEYCQSDIVSYVPPRQYDVILYGDSIYYIPLARIPDMLARYSGYLKDGGVFIARLFDVRGKRQNILCAIEDNFQIVEKQHRAPTEACLITFRPRDRGNSARTRPMA